MTTRMYFDHAATSPLDPRVKAAMDPWLEGGFGNPSSPYQEGREARQAIDQARAQVAELLHCLPEEIIFTASGTEADNLAILGALRTARRPAQVITSALEHAAVLETCHFLEAGGVSVKTLDATREGFISPGALQDALRADTRLVSIMAANNITGVLQPMAELVRVARRQRLLFHTDAVQAVGKIPIDVKAWDVDLLSLSAHKLHGPKGVGALYVRRGVGLAPVVFGGGQERGLRSATENVAGIVGLGAAAELAREEMARESGRLAGLRELLLRGLRERLPGIRLIGHASERLPGHLCLGFPGEEETMAELVLALDEAGVAVSAGSACGTGHGGPRVRVLEAMGFDAQSARGLLRVSLGRFNTEPEVGRFLEILPLLVKRPAETLA